MYNKQLIFILAATTSCNLYASQIENTYQLTETSVGNYLFEKVNDSEQSNLLSLTVREVNGQKQYFFSNEGAIPSIDPGKPNENEPTFSYIGKNNNLSEAIDSCTRLETNGGNWKLIDDDVYHQFSLAFQGKDEITYWFNSNIVSDNDAGSLTNMILTIAEKDHLYFPYGSFSTVCYK
ncbi:hypothetical protein [Vibrio owensii]|uniref:hypothetical protein n=1 Tax=Vibrio owensii TaxID=696485 RepID=UPI00221E7842|nr:hypothetical protein [Vibrio owensii]